MVLIYLGPIKMVLYLLISFSNCRNWEIEAEGGIVINSFSYGDTAKRCI